MGSFLSSEISLHQNVPSFRWQAQFFWVTLNLNSYSPLILLLIGLLVFLLIWGCSALSLLFFLPFFLQFPFHIFIHHLLFPA